MPKHETNDTPSEPNQRGRRIAYVFGLAAVLLVAAQLLRPTSETNTIRYDEFKQLVRSGQVQSVTISPEGIRGTYVAGRTGGPETGEGTEAKSTFSTGRVEDPALVAFLEENRVGFRSAPASGWGEDWWTFALMGLSVVFFFSIFRRGFQGLQGGGALAFGKSKGKTFQATDVNVSFSDVAGVDEAKAELKEIIDFLKSPERYTAIGAKIPKGVLLVGPPGTGKTLLARAVAGEAGVPFISISASEFVELFVGVGAARVRDLFVQAEKSAPCIVFIDELDAIGRTRSGVAMGGGGHEEREQTLNQLLVELDGFAPNRSVIIMSATNRPEVLDPALLRPGRFDRQISVDRPDRGGREQILVVHCRGVRLSADVDLLAIASRTPGFAGADLANLVNEAALLAARHERAEVCMSDFSDAIDRVVAGLQRKSRILSEDERRRIAHHEVGHALASVLSGSLDQVHKISIIPRGFSALGFTMQAPEQDRYLLTESELRVKLVGLLGGWAAEQVVFGEASTGAQDDLRKATEIATAMVTDFGMSERVGLVSVRSGPSRHFPGPGLAISGSPSQAGDALSNLVDSEVRAIVGAASERATKLLGEHRATLQEIAGQLLEREQLEGDELRKLLSAAKSDAGSQAGPGALPAATSGNGGPKGAVHTTRSA